MLFNCPQCIIAVNVFLPCFQVIILWTANTERFSDVVAGLNDTSENLLASIAKNASEVAPSTLFAVASILENVSQLHRKLSNAVKMQTSKTMSCLV